MEYTIKTVSTVSFNIKDTRLDDTKYTITPSFGKAIKKLNDEMYEVKLIFTIKNENQNITPYEIELIIKGVFVLKNPSEGEVDEFLKINAIQILFPYLRSILSSAMSALMITPILLPLMDARYIFEE
ncbi:MAG: protein-export chaperone SecB [Roseburia sp.]|nr:protein-export chaperone SecB [Anaeroplasma bactoclasticum]MCM1195480.1 protein-export chaperone SecB [Roseburia sp.]MCM1555958.1 protein-export chaperone SecB [Anaeroplasma bactoclasticum]